MKTFRSKQNEYESKLHIKCSITLLTASANNFWTPWKYLILAFLEDFRLKYDGMSVRTFWYAADVCTRLRAIHKLTYACRIRNLSRSYLQFRYDCRGLNWECFERFGLWPYHYNRVPRIIMLFVKVDTFPCVWEEPVPSARYDTMSFTIDRWFSRWELRDQDSNDKYTTRLTYRMHLLMRSHIMIKLCVFLA